MQDKAIPPRFTSLTGQHRSIVYTALTGLCIGLTMGCGWEGRAGDCGDGIKDPVAEECDDGDLNKDEGEAAPGECTRYCRLIPECGNGTKEDGEACDGGPEGGKWCTATCSIIPGCGNGTAEMAEGEQCDDGEGMNGKGMPCNAVCEKNFCGDGDQLPTEQCDDGNKNPNDGCDSCSIVLCGNGVLDADEDCDNGPSNTATPGYDECSTACTLGPHCGDEMQQTPQEECDDGNTNSEDSCTTECKNAVCGDGFTQLGVEECDNGPGNNGEGQACNAMCFNNTCGDGDKGPVETCDDGNTFSGDGCDETCQCASTCGNGTIECWEECDDMNDNDLDNCSNNCRTPRWVFVTSGSFTGELNGITGADKFCEDAGKTLGGKYMAWLTDGDEDSAPATRFASSDFMGWYRLPSKPPTPPIGVARGWADLTTPNADIPSDYLQAAITHTEIGDPVVNGSAWTNTRVDGTRATATDHCGNWKSAEGTGRQGSAKAIQAAWTENDVLQSCGVQLRLYCFQVGS